jgi:hypothetical protein
MASFTLVRELASLERDRGSKRLLLALYSASDEGSNENRRYIALSEQQRSNEESEWQSARKGITVRRGELEAIISALQSADFDAKPDGKGLSDREYAEATGYIT